MRLLCNCGTGCTVPMSVSSVAERLCLFKFLYDCF